MDSRVVELRKCQTLNPARPLIPLIASVSLRSPLSLVQPLGPPRAVELLECFIGIMRAEAYVTLNGDSSKKG